MSPLLALLACTDSHTEAPSPSADRTSTTLSDGTDLDVALDVPVVDGDAAALTGTVALVPPATPTQSLIFMLDVSASTYDSAGGCIDADFNGDSLPDTILDCALAGAWAAVEAATSWGTVGEVGIVAFGGTAGSGDMGPASGTQAFASPTADEDGDGEADVETVLANLRSTGFREFSRVWVFPVVGAGTNFSAGIEETCGVLTSASYASRTVIFLSDGEANGGDPVDTVLPCTDSAVFQTVGIGDGSCDADAEDLGSLRDVAALTGGACTEAATPADIAAAFAAPLVPTITSVTRTVGDAAPEDVAASIAEGLPWTGAGTLHYAGTLAGLTEDTPVCLRATADQGGVLTEVSDCQVADVNDAPVFGPLDDSEVDEGALVTLDAPATDADGDTLSWSWSTLPATPLIGATTAAASLYALDDDSLDVTTTVTDGALSATETRVLTIANVAPTMTVTVSPAELTLAQVRFTDPGIADTHTLTVDWGDGTADSAEAVLDATGWGLALLPHRYAEAGAYDVAVTLEDDDGGLTSWADSIEVAPTAAIHASSTADDAITTAGGSIVGLIHGNGGVTLGGAGSVDGPVEYGSFASIGAEVVLSEPAILAPPTAPPHTWTVADHHPGGRAAIAAGAAWHDLSDTCVGLVRWRISEALAPGVYYAPCDVELRTRLEDVTIVSDGSIYATSGGVVGAYIDGVALLAAADVSLDVEGGDWLGAIVAGGSLTVGGSGNHVVGSLIAERVHLTDPEVLLDASDPTPGATPEAFAAPRVVTAIENDAGVSLPGVPVTTTATLTHSGVDLVVPGSFWAMNRGSDVATLEVAEVTVEAWDGTAWTALDTTWGAVGDGEPAMVGTSLAPGASATWALWVGATIDAADWPSLATATVRVVTTTDWGEGAIVETTPGLGVEQALPTEVDVTDAELWLAGIDGLLEQREAGALAPGEVFRAEMATVWTAPAPGGAELAADWIDRLTALDGSAQLAMALGRGTATVGPVVAPQATTQTEASLPVVSLEAPVLDTATVGLPAPFDVATANVGSAPAGATWSCTLGSGAAGSASLVPGERRSDAGSVTPTVEGEAALTCTWSWEDEAGSTYGPVEVATSVAVGAPAQLAVSLTDILSADTDGDGVPSPGDTIRYTAVATNTGGVTLASARLTVTVDPASTLSAGATSAGRVELTGSTLDVDWGSLAGGASATTTFDVVVSAAASSLSVQGTATSDVGTVFTDDPSVGGTADPTVTPLWTATPALAAALLPTLRIDADGDGGVSTGDTLRYSVALLNAGAAAARSLTLTIPVPAEGQLVSASATSSAGIVTTDSATVSVDIGDLAGDTQLDASFDVLVVGAPASTLVLQGTYAGADVSGVTDDPTTGAADDATALTIGGSVVTGGADAPVVTWVHPTPGDRVAMPTGLEVTISTTDGSPPASWALEILDADGASTTLASGTGDPTLDLFDPTLLDGGVWTVRLLVTDAGGNTGVGDAVVEVPGSSRLGSLDVAFDDASWKTGIYPVTIRRTYSTRRRGELGDFGYGWALEVDDFELQRNGPLGDGGWTQESCGSGFLFTKVCTVATTPHLVAVRWPDGHVEAFDVETETGSTFFSAVTAVKFTPRDGVTSTLRTLDGEDGVTFLGGSLYAGLGATTVYDPQQLWLTDRDGVQYLLDRDLGLVEIVDRDDQVTRFESDGIVPVLGEGVSWVRDDQGRILAIDQPDGSALLYTYDEDGNLSTVFDAEGRTTEFSYDEEHRLTGYSGGGAPTASMEYDADGRLIATTDPNGLLIESSVDLESWTETTVGPDPDLVTTSQYNEDGLLVALSTTHDGTTATRRWTYDDQYRPVTHESALGNVTTVAYDDAGRVTDEVDPDGVHTEYEWSATGELLTERVDGAVVSQAEYDDAGHLLERALASGTVVARWTWTEDGLPATAENGDGASVNLEYTSDGALSAWTDGAHRVDFIDDAFGVAVGFTDAGGTSVVAETDGSGNVLGFADALGYTEARGYDAEGRLSTMTDKLGRSSTISYDDAGYHVAETERSGAELRYTYDTAGRLSRVDGPDVWVAYTWDAEGRLVRAENADTVVTLEYDEDGQLLAMSSSPTVSGRLPEWTSATDWSPGGRLLSEANPVTTTTYTWDAAGRLSTLSDGLTGTWIYAWDADSRLSTITREGGLTTRLAFSPAGDLEEVDAGVAAVEIDRDEAGRVALRTTAAGASVYAYDDRGQLAEEVTDLGSEAWTYDDNGNRDDGPVVADRLQADPTWAYSWDEDGRLASKTDLGTGAVTTYTWNAFDELVAIDTPEGRTTYKYDALGRRVEVDHRGTVQRFTYTGYAVAAVYDGSNVLQSWQTHDVWGVLLADWSAEAGVREAIVDQLGSLTAWWTPEGVAAEARSAWGEGLSPEGVSPSALSWHEADPTGLIYMRARYYDPAIGRFLSEDPLWSANAYRYADNDPVGSWDPFGWSTGTEEGVLTDKETAQTEARREMAKEIACVITRNAVQIAMANAAAGMVAETLLETKCKGKCKKGDPITVIGRHRDYRYVAKALGDNVSFFFDKSLGSNPAAWWPPNEAWLRERVNKGDCLIMSNTVKSAIDGRGFHRELSLLRDLGVKGGL